jgi:hypothetical protein
VPPSLSAPLKLCIGLFCLLLFLSLMTNTLLRLHESSVAAVFCVYLLPCAVVTIRVLPLSTSLEIDHPSTTFSLALSPITPPNPTSTRHRIKPGL